MCGAASLRIKEATRVSFWPDEIDPDRVIRGRCELAKDGEPLELFAPALGVLGPFGWLREHLSDMARVGQVFPAWTGGYGSKGDAGRATAFTADIAAKEKVVVALYSVWRAPPLAMDEARRKALGYKAHGEHGSMSDVMRLIGMHPQVPYPLEEDLRRGFSRTERRISGHWLRDKSEPDEAPVEWRGARPAQPPGAAPRRDQMEDAYTRGAGRFGERSEQIRARLRLWRFLQAAYRYYGRDWQTLPDDGSAWYAVVLPGTGAAGVAPDLDGTESDSDGD